MKHAILLVATTALALGVVATPTRARATDPHGAAPPRGGAQPHAGPRPGARAEFRPEPQVEPPRSDVSPEDATTARVLFEEGRRLASHGHHLEACPKFEESQRLDPGMGTAFNLADCFEHTERGATAWMLFLDVAARAKAAGMAPREAAARARALAIEPKLSKLVVMVPPATDVQGLEIKRDGRALGRAQWGSAIYVDGGNHEIAATAPGRRRWSATPFVKGMADTVIVTLPVLEPDGTPAPTSAEPPPVEPSHAEPAPPRQPPAPPAAHVAPALTASVAGAVTLPSTLDLGPSKPATPAEGSAPGQTQRIIGLGAVGVGALGVGLGAYFLFSASGQASDSKAYCEGNVCKDARGVQLRQDAASDADKATISGLVGVGALLVGAVVYFTAPSAKSARRAQALDVKLGPRGMAVSGVW